MMNKAQNPTNSNYSGLLGSIKEAEFLGKEGDY
jgi:hypothetical protein